jgi:hypothetical protein
VIIASRRADRDLELDRPGIDLVSKHDAAAPAMINRMAAVRSAHFLMIWPRMPVALGMTSIASIVPHLTLTIDRTAAPRVRSCSHRARLPLSGVPNPTKRYVRPPARIVSPSTTSIAPGLAGYTRRGNSIGERALSALTHVLYIK